ncbi:MAG TPA: TA system VapC family ribonuclease toxin [Pseudomonadales bacterium]|nr:TA system VapC family ribonuclease toxin [Pseudomonadales bacterium]
MIAIDTNVLVYGHRGETDQHETALKRLTLLCEGIEPWALPLPCVSEFFRVVTHPRVFNPPSRLSEALDFVASLLDAPSCRILSPGHGYLDHFFTVLQNADARGNLVFDAQIVALCREHGVSKVLTNDRDFERFEGISVDYLQTSSGVTE